MLRIQVLKNYGTPPSQNMIFLYRAFFLDFVGRRQLEQAHQDLLLQRATWRFGTFLNRILPLTL